MRGDPKNGRGTPKYPTWWGRGLEMGGWRGDPTMGDPQIRGKEEGGDEGGGDPKMRFVTPSKIKWL